MTNSSWLIGWGALSVLAINLSQLPAVASDASSVNRVAQSTFLIAVNRPVLKLGSQGAEVSELQAALKLLGYFAGTVNGFYGESTAIAVSRFQQVSGLNADGIAGAATWNRLFPSIPTTNKPSPTVSTNRQTSSTTTASGFPVPSSLRTTTRNPDSRVNVGTPPQVTRPQYRTPIVTSPPNSSTAVNPQTVVVTLPILKQGMRGSAIAQLQERLRSLGFFSGSIDGIFGEATQAAVKAAQQKFNLQPDGIVGSATWSALLR